MRLSRVQIKNFRSIADIEISFDPQCRTLVGINESGKSNILTALSLLQPNKKPSRTDLREIGSSETPYDEAYVRFIFTIDNKDREALLEPFWKPIVVEFSSTPVITLKGDDLSLKGFLDSREEVLYHIDLKTGSKYFSAWRIPKACRPIGAWKRAIKGLPDNVTVTFGENEYSVSAGDLVPATAVPPDLSEHFEDADAGSFNSAFIQAVKEALANQLPSCLYWTYNEANLLPPQVEIDGFASDPSTCQPLANMFALAGIDNIQSSIKIAQERPHGLKNLLNRVAVAATEHLKSIWKDHIISFELSVNGEHIDASVKDHFNSFDFSSRSDGFKRFVSFLLLVSAQVRRSKLVNTLYLHDEPDIGLHPSGARYLRDELISISASNYVVFSTHSIFMIDKDRIDRHLIVSKKREITTVEEATDSNIVNEEVIFNALGYSVFETLNKKNIIFEGWRDKRLFNIAARDISGLSTIKKNKLAKVGCCHAKGVKDIRCVAPLLDLANRQWIVVSDSDAPAREQQHQFKGGPWLRYDQLTKSVAVVTAEDYIQPHAFKPALDLIQAELPSLNPFDVTTFGPTGRLDQVKKWLQAGGITGDTQKTVLHKIKSSLFENLQGSQIEPVYLEVLESLIEELKL